MPSIPSEELFIDHISDIRTLKNCALTAAIFRQPAQKALFRRFDLGDLLPWSINSTHLKIQDILEIFCNPAHAHLTGYVRELAIYLDTRAVQDAALREAIFAALTNVRKCTIAGDLLMRRWINADRGYLKSLLEWLSACDGLRELVLNDIDGILPVGAPRAACDSQDGDGSTVQSAPGVDALRHERHLRVENSRAARVRASPRHATLFEPVLYRRRAMARSTAGQHCRARHHVFSYAPIPAHRLEYWLLRDVVPLPAFPSLVHFSLGIYTEEIVAKASSGIPMPVFQMIPSPHLAPAFAMFTLRVLFTYSAAPFAPLFGELDALLDAHTGMQLVEFTASFMKREEAPTLFAAFTRDVVHGMSRAVRKGLLRILKTREIYECGRF
ncbi:hypothetical protein MKEN_00750900 [Mycena kentingensis (nom. inval.)]|nr:hypothetical protein MKEN_00750900 [Mycena kentingensis (nom. inval.)]